MNNLSITYLIFSKIREAFKIIIQLILCYKNAIAFKLKLFVVSFDFPAFLINSPVLRFLIQPSDPDMPIDPPRMV